MRARIGCFLRGSTDGKTMASSPRSRRSKKGVARGVEGRASSGRSAGSTRVALAHLPADKDWSRSLCGGTTIVKRCDDCESIYRLLTEIHIQLPRQPSRAFCGRDLQPGGDRGSGRRPSEQAGDQAALTTRRTPFYVTISQARDLLQDAHLEICNVCKMNLRRFDDRMLMGRNATEDEAREGRDEE